MERKMSILKSEISRLESQLLHLINELDSVNQEINRYECEIKKIENGERKFYYYATHAISMNSEKSIVDDIHRPDEIRAKEIEKTNKQYEKLKIKSDIDDLKINIIIKKCELSRLEYDYKNKNSLNKYKSRSPQM